MKKTVLMLSSFLIAEYWALNTAKSKDLGIHGHTFEIQEPDLLKELESKLYALKESGEIDKHQGKLRQKAEEAILSPPAIEGITKAKQDRTWYYDPSFTVAYDLKDHQGRVFHKKGAKINPLQYLSLSSTLIFIDGSDDDQLDWLSETYQKPNLKVKIILIAGSPVDLMASLNEPIYFDQGGALTKKLGIKHVPSCVFQEGLKLKIVEIALGEVRE